MFSLLLAVLVGLVFAILATQNATPVPVNLLGYQWTGLPLYLVGLGALLGGVLLSSLFSLATWASGAATIASKDSQLSKTQGIVNDLKTRVRDLELENEKLRGAARVSETKADVVSEQARIGDHVHYNPYRGLSFWDRLRYRLAL